MPNIGDPKVIDLRWLDNPKAKDFDCIVLNQPVPSSCYQFLKVSTGSILCADGGADRLRDSDIDRLPSVVIGDLDSLEPGVHEQESTDFQKVLRITKEERFERQESSGVPILVFGVAGGRLDQTISNLSVMYKFDKKRNFDFDKK
eukprot:Trichotokara_eunicae@DN3302_c0_g1_i3.p1